MCVFFLFLFYLANPPKNKKCMSLEEFEDTPDKKTKRYILMRSITDFGMGILYIGVGVLILFAKRFHFASDFSSGILPKIFSVIVIVYGAWRIYRGVQKKYFKE